MSGCTGLNGSCGCWEHQPRADYSVEGMEVELRSLHKAGGFRREMVERPAHYNVGKIEVLDFIEDQNFNFAEGAIIKYVCRYKYKGAPVEDLRKARFYLDRLIAAVSEVP